MKNKKFNGTKEELYCLYWIEKLPTKEIAKKFNVSQGAIYQWLRKFNIPIRGTPHSEEHKRKISQSAIKFKCPKEELYNLYWIQKLPVKEIAKKFNVNVNTIWNWLKIYQIPLRGRVFSEQERKKLSQIKTKFKITKDELFKLYVVEKKDSKEIAKMFNVNNQTVLNWLKRYNIPIRTKSEINKIRFQNTEFKKKFSQIMRKIFEKNLEIKKKIGEKSKERWENPNYKEKIKQKHKKRWENPIFRKRMSQKRKELWQNPIYRLKVRKSLSKIKRRKQQREPREERKLLEYKLWVEAVFKRDNYTCQKCGKKGKKLEAHHIFNWADYPELRYAIDNGITLCRECHKEFHKQFGLRKNTKAQLEAFLKGWQVLDGGKLNEASNN
jgi:transposase/5-methylcytosine-specific restriction endonuclease McrA